MGKNKSAISSEGGKTRDLNEYAAQMGKFITELKTSVADLTDNEISMMIEENKVCKAMFQQVFNVLVIEQTRRLNQSQTIEKALEKCEI